MRQVLFSSGKNIIHLDCMGKYAKKEVEGSVVRKSRALKLLIFHHKSNSANNLEEEKRVKRL
jgi:hypothetical protein